MKQKIWISGEVVEFEKAQIQVLSPSAQYGLNVFEGVRSYLNASGQELNTFRLQEHIDRLYDSCKLLKLEVKYSRHDIIDAFNSTIRVNNYLEDISTRIFLFINGAGNWAARGPCEMMISPVPMGRAFSDKSGLALTVSTWQRINENSISPKAKCGANYINSRMAHIEAVENGYDTGILLNSHGYVSEAPGACLFLIKDQCLVTPSMTNSILNSITRDSVINICLKELGLRVIERNIDRSELYLADEAFLCGTAMEIKPVLSFNKVDLGDGSVGPLCKSLMEIYDNICRKKNSLFSEWLSPVR